jgi:RNA polymerase sigma-70 factor (ECF subfamily)
MGALALLTQTNREPLSATIHLVGTSPAEATASEAEAELYTAIVKDTPGWKAQAYREFQGLVRGLVVKSLGPKADVEDIVSDVFVRFLENARRIRSAHAVRSYLVSIAVNCIRREARNRKRRAFLGRFFFSNEELERKPGLDDPKAKAALIQLSRILDELHPEDKAVFVLRAMERMPIPDIAKTLKMSHSTAKRRAQRASERVLKRVSRNALLADYVREKNGKIE